MIRDVVSGLICGRPGVDQRICFATATIHVTGEGECVYDRRNVPCTWFGVSFTYAITDSVVTLTCDWSSDSPVTDGNPAGVRARHATTGTTPIVLRKGRTYHLEPFYMVMPTDPKAFGMLLRSRYICSYAGRHLFSFAFDIHTPER